jgi:hypothetical protein
METVDGMQMEAGSESTIYIVECKEVMHHATE